jgi:hypothetical protein
LVQTIIGMEPQVIVIGIPQLIIAWPARIIMHGGPLFIIAVSMPHMSFIICIVAPSPGAIAHFMPFSVMTQVMRQFIGIIIGTGIGIDVAIGSESGISSL